MCGSAAPIERARKHAEDKEKRCQDRTGADDPDYVETAGREAADTARPKARAQADFTDPESRIMKNSDGAFMPLLTCEFTRQETHVAGGLGI